MLNLDFSSVPSREPLEEGIYDLVVAEAEETTSSNGNPMLKLTFNVGGVDGDRKLWDNFVLIDKCLWKVKELLDAIGMDTSSIVEMDPAELIGQPVRGKVIQKEYNGDIINNVKKYYAA